MAINYPSGTDTFPVPTLPEATSLSSAGTGTRDHTEHHQDLGLAVVALESNAAKKTHDHSGDGTDPSKGVKLLQANTHQTADTDTDPTGIHHTLGISANQAAAGNHAHDYTSASIFNKPLVICTSTTRPPSPLIGELIFETDTNAMRVWTNQTGALANVGIFGEDDFERTSSTDLGSALWSQTYTLGTGHGTLATPDGHAAGWIVGGTVDNRSIARRIKPADAITQTDDQQITITTGNTAFDRAADPYKASADFGLDIYLRMSVDGLSYIRVAINSLMAPEVFKLPGIRVYATAGGPADEILLGSISTDRAVFAAQIWKATVVGRIVSLYNNNGLLGTVVDSDHLSNTGTSYRGWGIGMNVWGYGSGQYAPSTIVDATVQDVVFYTDTHKWAMLSAAAYPVVRLAQNAAQNILSGSGGGILEWQRELEDNFNFFNPAGSTTDIQIKESGLYSIEFSAPWPFVSTPDQWGTAVVGLEVNGLATEYQSLNNVPTRGSISAPFNTNLKAIIRLAEGDVVRVRAKHDADLSIFLFYKDGPNPINSRFDLVYLMP